MNLLKKLYFLLDENERVQFIFLVFLMILSAIAESAGVASIAPLLAVVARPSAIQTSALLHHVYVFLNLHSSRQMIYVLAALPILVLLVGNTIRAVNTWISTRYAWASNHALSRRLMLEYLRRPYASFLSTNSANLSNVMLSEVGEVTQRALVPILRILSEGFVILSLLATLFIVNPYLPLMILGVFGGMYGLVYLTLQQWLDRLGKDRLSASRQRYFFANEAFGGIKDIKLIGCEDVYLNNFSWASLLYADVQARVTAALRLPIYAIEIAAYATIVGIVLYVFTLSGDTTSVLPLVGIYAMAGRRILPAMQSVFSDFSTVKFAGAGIDRLIENLDPKHRALAPEAGSGRQIVLASSIELRDLHFRYASASRDAVDGISLNIKAGSRIAFVGTTGSGKTTLADLILGLLQPTSGKIFVDGKPLGLDETRLWQKNLGYVPQQIYLADDSLRANIAFGVPSDEIDDARVEMAGRTACLHDFISSDLPDGYATHVGERGVRLSGGQRQRVGIARALYRNASVLIFDEATSALDTLTENEVMKAIDDVAEHRTIIIIAHRLSTVRGCDRIFMMKSGRIVTSGKYDELVAEDANFRAFVSGGL